MATNAAPDAILKIYNSGNLKGKYALFFNSLKAIEVYKSLRLEVIDGAYYIVAGLNTDENLKKVRAFLDRHQLHYEEVILN